MLSIRNLRHDYGGRTALALAGWSVPQGGHTLVLGPSGSGKTTLLHVLAGVLRPGEGEVVVADQDLRALRGAALDRFRGRTIGIVLQQLHLVASLTVLRNVMLAQYAAGLPQDRDRALATLASLGMDGRADARPAELSQGQAQRVALARAVVNQPKLLLADEPTANLDDANAAQALDLLVGQAMRCNATLVIATHDQRVKERIAQRLELGQAGAGA